MTALLQGKTAVITGGSTGIGLATAKRFAEEGAYVFINGRTQAELDAAVREIGENVTGVQGDGSKPGDRGPGPGRRVRQRRGHRHRTDRRRHPRVPAKGAAATER